MRTNPLILVSGIWLCGTVLAGAQAPTAANQQFVRDVQLRQSQIQGQMALQSLTDEILAIDGEIERKVDKLVSMMVEVTDSVDSGRKIANQKEQLMQGLKNTMDFYQAERQKRQADLTARYQRIPREDLERGVQVLDEKVDRRVAQIMEISASLAGHEDVQKYERYYDDWDDGWYGEGGVRVSREYRHNQRQSGKTSRVQEGVMEGLGEEAERLERENADLRRRIPVTLDAATRAAMEQQVARNEKTLSVRRDQRVDSVTSSSTTGRTVSSREATTMDRLMRDMVEEIRHDFGRLQALVNQRNVELQRIQMSGGR